MREYADLRSFQDGRMALEAVDTFVITLELVYRKLIAREQLHGFNADGAHAGPNGLPMDTNIYTRELRQPTRTYSSLRSQ